MRSKQGRSIVRLPHLPRDLSSFGTSVSTCIRRMMSSTRFQKQGRVEFGFGIQASKPSSQKGTLSEYYPTSLSSCHDSNQSCVLLMVLSTTTMIMELSVQIVAILCTAWLLTEREKQRRARMFWKWSCRRHLTYQRRQAH